MHVNRINFVNVASRFLAVEASSIKRSKRKVKANEKGAN
jgi:hypothetical protein